MQMVYNSDAYTVVEIEVPESTSASPSPVPAAAAPSPDAAPAHTPGFEIVDKVARTDVFLVGDLAIRFRDGVAALSEGDPSPDEIDAFITRFTGLSQQPLVLH